MRRVTVLDYDEGQAALKDIGVAEFVCFKCFPWGVEGEIPFAHILWPDGRSEWRRFTFIRFVDPLYVSVHPRNWPLKLMGEKNMRHVMVMQWDPVAENPTKIDQGPAIFHSFGQESAYEDNGNVSNWPVAIVEYPDGTLSALHVDFVRFIDPPR